MEQSTKNIWQKTKVFVTTHALPLSIAAFVLFLSGLFLTVYQLSFKDQVTTILQSAPLVPHKDCSMPRDEANADAEEKKLFNLVNDYRKSKGLSALVENEELRRAAAWMAIDMAKNNRFSHTDSLGRAPGKRVVDCGYYGEENQVRENLAKGQTTAQEVFNGWKASKIHNETMLDETMAFGGVGRKEVKSTSSKKKGSKKTATGTTYAWAMTFAQDEETEEDPTSTDPCATTQAVSAGGASVGGKNKKEDKKDKDKKSDKEDSKNGGKGGKNNDDKDDKKKKDNKKKKTKKKKKGSSAPEESGTGDDCIPADEGGEEELGEEELEEEEEGVTRPEAPSLQFAIRIPGSEDLGDIRDVTIDFSDLTGKTVTTEAVEVENFAGDTYIGYLEYGTKIPSGIYRIRAKLPNSLRRTIQPEYQRIDSTADLDLPEITMVMGDFDRNNVLNIFDFNIFKNCMDIALFEEEESEEEIAAEFEDEEFFEDELEEDEAGAEAFDVLILAESCSQHDDTDLNGDGFVDILDYEILLQGFQNARGN